MLFFKSAFYVFDFANEVLSHFWRKSYFPKFRLLTLKSLFIPRKFLVKQFLKLQNILKFLKYFWSLWKQFFMNYKYFRELLFYFFMLALKTWRLHVLKAGDCECGKWSFFNEDLWPMHIHLVRWMEVHTDG